MTLGEKQRLHDYVCVRYNCACMRCTVRINPAIPGNIFAKTDTIHVFRVFEVFQHFSLITGQCTRASDHLCFAPSQVCSVITEHCSHCQLAGGNSRFRNLWYNADISSDVYPRLPSSPSVLRTCLFLCSCLIMDNNSEAFSQLQFATSRIETQKLRRLRIRECMNRPPPAKVIK